eukprot:TRINITY_DN1951_c0_g1_i1.p1 TRINITY_DN1951_c0_g1~~TRINITY_DN1951_c0_g1_i1.p1  ORF type:complete len:390 (+),score=121.52 TRINITY_DN1951_c0_g1_i1:65-1234(+)
MPAKKKDSVSVRPTLGRFKNSLSLGIVGYPNVGKSTFFNLLTKQNVPAENYEFCTRDPNQASAIIDDPRFDYLVELFKPKSKVPARLEVWDIAGLIRGASEGRGLGNQFLSHIRAVDGIFHMVRVFSDIDVVHSEGEVDPVRDMQVITDELMAKDLSMVLNHLEGLTRKIKAKENKDIQQEYNTLMKAKEYLEDKKQIRFCDWEDEDIPILNQHMLLTAKPVIYLLNMSTRDLLRKKNKHLKRIAQWVAENGGERIIPWSASYEQELDNLQDMAAQRIEETGTNSALNSIVESGYNTIGLIHYFTAGTDEVKAWTIKNGYTAPQAAGVIHTDFEKGFICADVMKFDDLKELGSERAVKSAGKMSQQGRNYIVEDGDICHFKFNVSKSKK